MTSSSTSHSILFHVREQGDINVSKMKASLLFCWSSKSLFMIEFHVHVQELWFKIKWTCTPHLYTYIILHTSQIIIISINVSLTRVVRDLWSDVLRSNDDGIGMTVGLELSQPARQCDDKLTASVGSKLARLWGLNLYGESRDDRGTLTLKRETNLNYFWLLLNSVY